MSSVENISGERLAEMRQRYYEMRRQVFKMQRSPLAGTTSGTRRTSESTDQG